MSNSSKKTIWGVVIVAAILVAGVLLYFLVFNDAAKYSKLVNEADAKYAAHQLVDARQLYSKAFQLLPEEAYPQEQILVIDSMLAHEEMMNRYTAKLDEADRLFSQKKYEKAREYYFEALNINSDDEYPVNQIKKIEVLMAGAVAEELAKEQPGNFYHVIVGVFDNEQNALNLQQLLKNEGKNSRLIDRPGQMKAVTYGSYSDIHEAYNYLQFIKNEINDDAWVLYKKIK